MKINEILSFYNLEQNPFAKEIKVESLLSLPTIEEAEKKLHLLLETRGIGLLTGSSGCGKTSLLRKTAANLNPGLYRPYYICHSSLGTSEFYQSFAAALNLSPQGRRSVIFRKIKNHISELNDQQRIHPVIFIDEAHALTSETLKEIRMLTNFEYDSKNACTLILCGHPELRQKLRLNAFVSLANSITYSIRVDSLKVEETFTYIEHMITTNGGQPSVFSQNAKKLIHDLSKGELRSIGNISWNALVIAYQHKSMQVEKEHIQILYER
jgi:type II secretory pathway predicted ATPase ExeA